MEQARLTNATAYCVNHEENLSIYDSKEVFLTKSVHLSICDNKIRASKRFENGVESLPSCDPEAAEKIKTGMVIFSFLNSFFDLKNYSDPLIYYNETITEPLGGVTPKDYQLQIKRNTMRTDNGWLLESIKEAEAISIDLSKEEIKESNMKMSITLKAPRMINTTFRKYLKIQELLAQIGGLFSAMSILSQILLFDYLQFKYRVHYSQFALGKYMKNIISKYFPGKVLSGLQ
eukprot:CAMPEP_0170526320 /NCGR_PEP_ID=MMETSP0209-20121228/11767_1 /TAXON_ID=665100 ORGANISM="Litonotus pictus, Strain P1" /NCGR_SAMPLE_ID=MMETSP0209 /ASSEMBLY_ACC=CAM_ASM_000301 /LENGTH=231 /DNA_ID=CAMNT_0010816091 /DNA_START=369 /DNA_END=1065 /DNA_ORIENTATION=+